MPARFNRRTPIRGGIAEFPIHSSCGPVRAELLAGRLADVRMAPAQIPVFVLVEAQITELGSVECLSVRRLDVGELDRTSRTLVACPYLFS